MKSLPLRLLLCLTFAPVCRATLMDNLLAYYDFESTGTEGLANRAPGGAAPDATRHGGGAFNATANPSGPGFTGNAAFNGGDGLSNRGTLLVGNSLNLVDARGDAIRVGLGTAELGAEFSLSVWHLLAPGAGNNSDRFFAFEAENNFDVSWGTPSQTTTTGPLASLTYTGYVAGAPAGGVTPVSLGSFSWHHTVHVFETAGTNTTLRVHVNGVLVATHTAPTVNMDFTGLLFGRERTTPDPTGDRDWDGMLDELAVWTRPLAPEEITTLHALGQTGVALVPEPASGLLLCTGLAACFRFLPTLRRTRP